MAQLLGRIAGLGLSRAWRPLLVPHRHLMMLSSHHRLTPSPAPLLWRPSHTRLFSSASTNAGAATSEQTAADESFDELEVEPTAAFEGDEADEADESLARRDGDGPREYRNPSEQFVYENLEYFEEFFQYHNESMAERAQDPELQQFFKVVNKRRKSRAKLQKAIEVRREKRRAKAEANAAKRGPEAQAAFVEERRVERELIQELKRAPLADPETLVRSLGITPADPYWPYLLSQATAIGLNPTWTRLEKRRFLKLTLKTLRQDQVPPARLANPPRRDPAAQNAKVWNATQRFLSQSSADDDELRDVLSDDEEASGDASLEGDAELDDELDDDDDEFAYEQKAREAVRNLQQQQQQQPSQQPSSNAQRGTSARRPGAGHR